MVVGAAVVGGAVVGAAGTVVTGAPGVVEVFAVGGAEVGGAVVTVLEWVVVAGAWPGVVTAGAWAPFFGGSPLVRATLGVLLAPVFGVGGMVVVLEDVTAYAARAASVK